jgi:zeaxanthin epoxidase
LHVQVLGWVLGGNTHHLEGARNPQCRVGDKPRAFQESEFGLFMRDDDALWERANADWLLVAEREAAAAPSSSAAPKQQVLVGAGSSGRGSTATMTMEAPAATATATEPRFGLAPYEYKGVYLNLADSVQGRDKVTIVGTSPDCQVVLDAAAAGKAADRHARIMCNGNGKFQLEDMGSAAGTWVNGLRIERGATVQLHAGDVLEFGSHPAPEKFTLKLQHKMYRTDVVRGDVYQRISTGAMSQTA